MSNYNDIGNANRLINKYGDEIRFCHDIKTWFIWKEKLWSRDVEGEVFRMAVDIVSCIKSEFVGEDPAVIKARNSWANASAAGARLREMISIASYDERISMSTAGFDNNKFLFNVQDGTIELNAELDVLREHRREDMITKISPVHYAHHYGAGKEKNDGTRNVVMFPENKKWNGFLEQLTGGDKELEKFLQRAIGYSMSGDTKEEKLFFVHGRGGTGKGTFIESIKRVMGDYAKTVDFKTFVKDDTPSVRNDLARLVGARFVVSNEIEDGKALAEDVVKNFTGNDKVTARFLFKEHFEFYPTFKLWLVANDPPLVSGEDDAMWRRILRISLDNKVSKENLDVDLKKFLTTNSHAGQAILNWMLDGYAEYKERGLDPPQSVMDSTEEYKQEMEEHGDFFAPLSWHESYFVTNAEMWIAWCEFTGILPNSNGKSSIERRKFNKKMESMGAKRVVIDGVRYWRGVRFKQDEGEEEGEVEVVM